MPTPMATGDVFLLRVSCFSQGQLAVNTTAWEVNTVFGTGLSYEAMALNFDNLMAPVYLPVLSNISTYYGVQLYRVFPALPIYAPFNSAVNTAAGTGGNPLPSGITAVIKLTTGFRGPKYRGRMFVPFPYTAAVNAASGAPTATYLSLVASLAAEISSYTPSGANTVQVVPQIRGAAPAHTLTRITAATPGQRFSFLHKRGAYGRLNIFPPF